MTTRLWYGTGKNKQSEEDTSGARIFSLVLGYNFEVGECFVIITRIRMGEKAR